MLVKFTVENYMSFRDKTEFNMFPGDVRRHKHHIRKEAGVELLRAAAIYGANGSGKSNLVKAFDEFTLAAGGYSSAIDFVGENFKLEAKCNIQPIWMSAEFVTMGKLLEYGFITIAGVFVKEWLYERNAKTEDYEIIFERTGSVANQESKFIFHPKYEKTERDKERNKLLTSELVSTYHTSLNTLSGRNYHEIDEAFLWFNEIEIDYNDGTTTLIQDLLAEPHLMPFMKTNMSSVDVGLADIEILTHDLDEYFGKHNPNAIEKIKADLTTNRKVFTWIDRNSNHITATKAGDRFVVKELITRQKGKEEPVPFRIYEQSEGTQRMLELLPLVYRAINEPVVVVIDEIDDSLHPNILHELISKFMSIPGAKGQLIFTTHETHLLDLNIFRQDEIWFAEKDKEGVSHLYTLNDFTPRYDLDIEKGYLNGRFGAIPFLGHLEDLKWSPETETHEQIP